MGPGLYADIGKKARELLYKDYQTDQKFAVTTYTSSGVTITASGTQKNDLILGEIHSQLKNKGVTVDLKANSKSDLLTTVAIDNLGAPGLKAIFSFAIPDHRSGKAEVQYLHDYAGVNASVGLADKPVINFAGVLGTSSASAGVDVAFDAATGNFTKCNAALSVTHTDLMAALTLNNKGESLTGSYYHIVYPVSNTAVGAEVTHNFSTKEDVITFGTQHSMDPLTTVKARLNSYGKASALIQHEWRPKSFVTLSTEVDTKAIEKSSKVGLSVLLKP